MGLNQFGNRTKVLAENARNEVVSSASNAGKAIGETSSGAFAFYCFVMLMCDVLGFILSMKFSHDRIFAFE